MKENEFITEKHGLLNTEDHYDTFCKYCKRIISMKSISKIIVWLFKNVILKKLFMIISNLGEVNNCSIISEFHSQFSYLLGGSEWNVNFDMYLKCSFNVKSNCLGSFSV